MEQEILKFINDFKNCGGNPEAIEVVFTSGYCYWFAHILAHRFPNSEIMYDEVANHFGTKINDKIFDITGDITTDYSWIPFSELIERDELLYKRLKRDCIFKESDK